MKKAAKKKRRNTNPGRKHNATRTVHHYHNAKHKTRRRRNPSARVKAALGNLQTALPVSLAVATGLIGSRMIINFALPRQTGYVKGVAQIGAGIVLSIIAAMLFKKKPAIANGMAIGGLTAGLLQIADTATGTKYHLADLEADNTRVVYLPDQINSYLPAGMSGYEALSGYETLSDVYKSPFQAAY